MFLDFDGTISRCDVVDAILERYADPAWLQVEEQWRAGVMGSRECLQVQMDLVRASRDEIDALLDTVGLDAGFVHLLEACARRGIPVHVVSDGFDYCIQRILGRGGRDMRRLLGGARICASHLEPAGDDRWRVGFPFFPRECGHGCATCKPWVMRLLNPTHAPAIFVGDGLSDRYAAASADIVFAKAGLATFCLEQQIPYIRYDHLGEVAVDVDETERAVAMTSLPGHIGQRKAWAPK